MSLSHLQTAEKLKEAVDADVFPSDPLTLEHFGFSKVKTIEEEINLHDLYQGLLIHLHNPPLQRDRSRLAGEK